MGQHGEDAAVRRRVGSQAQLAEDAAGVGLHRGTREAGKRLVGDLRLDGDLFGEAAESRAERTEAKRAKAEKDVETARRK